MRRLGRTRSGDRNTQAKKGTHGFGAGESLFVPFTTTFLICFFMVSPLVQAATTRRDATRRLRDVAVLLRGGGNAVTASDTESLVARR